MNRDQALNLVFRCTPPDFRGVDELGYRSIKLYAEEGGGLRRLDDLTDAQILAHLPPAHRANYHPEENPNG